MGDSEVGILIRMDHFLDKLEEHLHALQDALANMHARQSAIEAELLKKDDYTDVIEQTKKRLEELDQALGVNKK